MMILKQTWTHGFSLVEVMVSLLIISIGLLGIAALQTKTFRYNHDAMLRSIATTQANAMIDRMRANMAGIEDGHYNNLNFDSNIPQPKCVSCTASQIATLDAAQWQAENKYYLPSGHGKIDFNANNGLYTVTVMWDSHRTGATGKKCSGNPSVDLTCIEMDVQL